MTQLRLLPLPPPVEGPTHGERRLRPAVSHLQLAIAPFPALRPPATPLLDRALAAHEETRPKQAHRFVTDRVLQIGTLKHARKTWCLACGEGKGAAPECLGMLDDRLAAPWWE